ncbi:MAG: RNA polymerase sigma factor [Candidatus Komeilibacteria bacterium]
MSEAAIIKACQQGDSEQFTLLYDKYVSAIYKFVYYRVSHREVAEDLTSQIWLKVLDRLDQYKIKNSSFSAWLYRIARNAVIDYYRTSRQEFDISTMELSSKEDLQREAEIKDSLNRVQKYLQELPDDMRDIVIMRLWDQLSYEEIAGIMDKSEASCKMMMSRALQKIRAQGLLVLLFISLLLNN